MMLGLIWETADIIAKSFSWYVKLHAVAKLPVLIDGLAGLLVSLLVRQPGFLMKGLIECVQLIKCWAGLKPKYVSLFHFEQYICTLKLVFMFITIQ